MRDGGWFGKLHKIPGTCSFGARPFLVCLFFLIGIVLGRFALCGLCWQGLRHKTALAACKSKAVQPVSAKIIKSSGRCPKPILTRPPCVSLLPKDNFLFGIIEKNPVFMRLFSIFPACFLFGIIGNNITARQFIIIVNSGKIYFFSVKRKNNRILLCIILLKYNNIANNPK